MDTQLEQANSELQTHKSTYEDVRRETEQLRKQLRVEEMAATKLKDQASELDKLEFEAKSRIDSLKDSLKLLTNRLADKEEETSSLRKQLTSTEATAELQQQQVSDEEAAKARIHKALDVERTAINALEKELKLKEGQFELDALAVKSKIQELQDALSERADATERLNSELASAKANALHLRQRLEQAQGASQAQRSTFENLLSTETEAIAALSQDLNTKKMKEVALREELIQNEDNLNNLEMKLQDAKDNELVLRGNVVVSREEASILQDKLDNRAKLEQKLLDQIEKKEAEIAARKSQVQQKALQVQNAVKQAEQAEKQTQQLKGKLKAEQDTEDALVKELEAAKDEFSKVTSVTSEVAPTQLQRAETARAEYANVLLKILRREV